MEVQADGSHVRPQRFWLVMFELMLNVVVKSSVQGLSIHHMRFMKILSIKGSSEVEFYEIPIFFLLPRASFVLEWTIT